MQWFDWLRLFTAIICIVACVKSTRNAKDRWDRYTPHTKDVWWAFNAALFLVTWGAFESLLTGAPGGPRNVLAFLFSLVSLRAVYRNVPDDDIIFIRKEKSDG